MALPFLCRKGRARLWVSGDVTICHGVHAGWRGGGQQLLSWHLLFYLQWLSSSHQGVFALAKLEMASVVPGCPSGSILEGAIFLGPAQPGGQDFLGWGKGLTWGVGEVLNPGVPTLPEGTHTHTHTLVRARLSLASHFLLEVGSRWEMCAW